MKTPTKPSQRKVATRLHPDAKDAIAMIAVAWEEEGKKMVDFLDLLDRANIEVTKNTLNTWKRKVHSQGHVHTPIETRGRKKKLSDAQSEILVGFLLDENLQKNQVDLEALTTFVFDTWEITVGSSFAQRFFKEYGFSSRAAKTKRGGYKLDFRNLGEIYLDFLAKLRRLGVYDIPPSKLCSVDFTFTSHRTGVTKTYSLRGG